MKILIIGNLGYIGPLVVEHLRLLYPNSVLVGFDIGYFNHALTTKDRLAETKLDIQYFGDVRNFQDDIIKDVDSVVYLAAISNDPMGNEFESVTRDVNYKSALKIAKVAKDFGVSNYVFASSCSVYGAGGNKDKTEDDKVNPLTEYELCRFG